MVQTLDFGRCEDTLFIALEYVEGTNLGAILARCRERNRAIPPSVFIQLALQICEGLEYIHNASGEQGKLKLVHRDIKPSNMLITAQGIVKISDFGVVKAGTRSGDTTVGALKGTVGYMSPEQARGEAVGPTSDIFSLAAMLYEMATFRRLFGEGDLFDVLQRVKACDIQAPIEAAGGYLPGLDRVLRRMLAPTPEGRYQSAGEVSAALRALPVRVADRKAVVAFVSDLGLLGGGGRDDAEATAPHADRAPGTSSGAGSQAARARPAHASSTRTMLLVVIVSVLLGLLAAAGTYRLVRNLLGDSRAASVVTVSDE